MLEDIKFLVQAVLTVMLIVAALLAIVYMAYIIAIIGIVIGGVYLLYSFFKESS